MFTRYRPRAPPKLVEISEKTDFRTHRVRLPEATLAGLVPGASVAHNGCCLTVTAIDGDIVSFDLMRETLRLTNLGELQPGDRVNVERSRPFWRRYRWPRHVRAYHLHCRSGGGEALGEQPQHPLPSARGLWQVSIWPRGYIGIDGISLTIGEVDGNEFDVNLIPETLQRTNIGARQPGDRINIEIDPQTQAIVDTVERILPDYIEAT